MTTPEGATKRVLRKALERGGYFSFWPVPSGYGRQMVDVVIPAVLIECKRPGITEPTPRQATIMRQARNAHMPARTYVVTLDDRGELVWLEQTD